MKAETLSLLKQEAAQGWEFHQDRNNARWKPIMEEYRLQNWSPIFDYVTRYVTDNKFEAPLFCDGRIGMMHKLLFKWQTHMAINDPEFAVEEINPDDEPIVELCGYAFEAHKRQIRFGAFAKKYNMWAGICGTGVGKVGVNSEFVYNEEAWAEEIPRNVDDDEERLWPTPVMTERGTPGPGRQSIPTVRCIPTPHICYDPLGNIGTTPPRRIYHLTLRPVADIWRDGRYARRARTQIFGALPDELAKDFFLSADNFDTLRSSKVAPIIECFDMASQRYCVFSEEADAALRDWTDYPFQLDNWSPYRMYQPIPDPESNWGIPYALLFLPQCRALNHLKTQVMAGISKDGKKLVLLDGDIYHDQLVSQMNAAPNKTFIRVEGLANNNDPNKGIHEIDFGGPSEALLFAESRIYEDANFMSGLDDPTRGSYRHGQKTTPTEVMTRQQVQGVDIDFMRGEYEEALEDIFACVCQHYLQTWDDRKLVKVIGDDPRLWFWVSAERARVQGVNMNIKVVVGSTEKRDKLTMRRQWIELLPRMLELVKMIDADQLMQAQGAPPSTINKQELLRITLERFDEKKSADRIMNRRDPARLLQKLMMRGIQPSGVSEGLQEQLLAEQMRIQRMMQGAAMGQNPGMQQQQQGGNPNIVSFEERNRVPQTRPNVSPGSNPESPGNIGGRALSEAL